MTQESVASSWRSSPRTACRVSTSSADSGSSSSRSRGSSTSARASATRCCSPPESWLGRRSASAPIPSRSSSARARSRAGRFATPCGPQAERDVSERVEVREERVALGQVADRARVGGNEGAGLPGEPDFAVQLDPAGVRAVESGEESQDGRLAGAALAHDDQRLAGAGLDGAVECELAEPLSERSAEHGAARRVPVPPGALRPSSTTAITTSSSDSVAAASRSSWSRR